MEIMKITQHNQESVVWKENQNDQNFNQFKERTNKESEDDGWMERHIQTKIIDVRTEATEIKSILGDYYEILHTYK